MAGVLQKYGIILIVLFIFIFLALLWLVVSKHNANKIPSRGVFVIQSNSFIKSGGYNAEDIYKTGIPAVC